ncbi:MAG TPA: hypothetical protein VF815_46730 [Myxococcaceae bacterium]|jgi:hypothetical protein
MRFASLVIVAVACVATSAPAQAQCVPVIPAFDDYAALSNFWRTSFPLCRLPNGANNAYADRLNGVVFADQVWLDRIATTYGSWAATGILAHEWGHMVQGQVSGTAAELQADCLAGVFMRGAGLPWHTVEQFAAVNWSEGGDPYWTPNGHGTRAQRVVAARRGYYGYVGQSGYALLALCPLSAF